MKVKSAKLMPIDIPLPANQPLEGGALFVRLPTLKALEQFWAPHRDALPFAARGIVLGHRQHFLGANEWVFAPTMAALVRVITRWDQIGITCSWYDWATDAPDHHAAYFQERSAAELNGRTPESFRGWWRLANLPFDWPHEQWFANTLHTWTLWDWSMSLPALVEQFQQLTFREWQTPDGEIETMDAQGVDDHIAFWRQHDAEHEAEEEAAEA